MHLEYSVQTLSRLTPSLEAMLRAQIVSLMEATAGMERLEDWNDRGKLAAILSFFVTTRKRQQYP